MPLSGVLTEPGPTAAPPTTAVVLLNAGVLHRIGANRLNVDLARRLAAKGLPAVRFDAAGIGESDSRGPRPSPLSAEVADIIEILDHVQATRGVHRFVLAGLCSGAEHALKAAGADPRVVGVVALEGYAYPTLRYWVRRYAPRLVHVESWRRAVTLPRSLVRRLSAPDDAYPDRDGLFGLRAALDRRRLPPQAEVEALLRKLVARRVALLAAYAGGTHHYYNYAGQLRDAFPRVAFGTLLEVVHEPRADHTFSDVTIRRRLVDRIIQWVDERTWASSASGALRSP